MGVVNQPVNEGRGQVVIAKNSVPLRKLQIGGNDEASAFVAVRNDLEQQLGGLFVQGNKADLVDDDQFHPL